VSVSQQGKRALLIVDEAQNLTPRAVEELRMLSNFQLETHALLQSFLVGQPEFRRTMQSPQMLQLRQRVIAACHIGPLDADETRGYIEHRLKCVGWQGEPKFQPGAYEGIYKASAGIPRRINAVCDRMLLSGYLAASASSRARTSTWSRARCTTKRSTPTSLRTTTPPSTPAKARLRVRSAAMRAAFSSTRSQPTRRRASLPRCNPIRSTNA
jgi:hypothetical protein